jgi:hypothetical protein
VRFPSDHLQSTDKQLNYKNLPPEFQENKLGSSSKSAPPDPPVNAENLYFWRFWPGICSLKAEGVSFYKNGI